MRFILKWGLLLIPALALAVPAFAPMPASAQTRDVRLSDSQQPGSVIIFPKFINRAPVRTDSPTGPLLPRTEIELGVVCPPGVPVTTTTCFEHQTIKVHAHWVCPGDDNVTTKYVCDDTDFVLFLSINGKLAFSADGRSYWSNSPRVPQPNCPNGYLIAWVVDNADRAIKFDGLIGEAVLRGPVNVDAAGFIPPGTSTAVSAYNGITIQAHPALALNALINLGGNELHFSGATSEYLGVTGVVYGDVKFNNRATDPAHTVPSPANAFSQTFLTFLTLDTNSGHPNNPTFFPITFYNESLNTVSTSNPLWEFPISRELHMICYAQFNLTDIHPDLTQEFMGARKGVFVAGPAEKIAFAGNSDETGDVTLLALVHTVEGTPANSYMERSYIYTVYNDSVFVETEFEWLPSRD